MIGRDQKRMPGTDVDAIYIAHGQALFRPSPSLTINEERWRRG
jgi:hypothetical protein